MIELKDTVDLMKSSDYKERFIAEYTQVKIRYEKLKKLITEIKNLEKVLIFCCNKIIKLNMIG